MALPEPLKLLEKATSPQPAAVLVHTKCGGREARRPLLRGGDHGLEGEEPPWGSSLCSESEPPAQNARSLARSPPRQRGAGIGGEPWPFAPLLWFVGGGARKRGKENIHRTGMGNLHFLAQSIVEGLETGTGGGARTRREKGCL